VDGSGLLPLPASVRGDYDPAWSPDGSKIAFTSLRKSGRPQIYVLTIEDESVISLSDEYDYSSQPAWSPDGKQIMYVSSLQGTPELWLMEADGDNKLKFSNSRGPLNLRPTWSPDGLNILFTQMAALGGIPKLVMAPFGPETYVEFNVTEESIPMREGVFSPDGLWIATEAWEAGGSHDIYIIAASGAGRHAITTDPRIDFDPAWKPVP